MTYPVRYNVKQLISENFDRRVVGFFRNDFRAPIYGKFVKCDDHEELWNKGFVRFVHEKMIDDWNVTNNIEFTRLFVISNFWYIKKAYKD